MIVCHVDMGISYTLLLFHGVLGLFLVFGKFREQSLEVPEDAWG